MVIEWLDGTTKYRRTLNANDQRIRLSCQLILSTRLPFSRRQTSLESACIYIRLCNLDLDPTPLMYELDLDILKMYLRAKTEVSRSSLSKVRAANRQMRPPPASVVEYLNTICI